MSSRRRRGGRSVSPGDGAADTTAALLGPERRIGLNARSLVGKVVILDHPARSARTMSLLMLHQHLPWPRARAREIETGPAHPPQRMRGLGHAWILVGAIVLLAGGLIGLMIAWRG